MMTPQATFETESFMPQMIKLCGGAALSSMRRNLILTAAQQICPITNLSAVWCLLLSCDIVLSPTQRQELAQLLNASDEATHKSSEAELFLVTPRMGTVSAWGCKARDILHHCGFSMVRRIERMTAFYVQAAQPLSAQNKTDLAALLHDRMTESVLSSFDGLDDFFSAVKPPPLQMIDILTQGESALQQANKELGLALCDEEIHSLYTAFLRRERNISDVELMMFAQANSEHCRHKLFNAVFSIDGVKQSKTLFELIRETHRTTPEGTVVAYSDNAAILEGGVIERFYPSGDHHDYQYHAELTHRVIKVETHNHPTAIEPFSGAATGAGGEIRDEGATGRGARPQAALTGFSVSHLAIPGALEPWESAASAYPLRIATAFDIMLTGPIGAAAFNNEFGRPNLAGYFRSFEQSYQGESRGYHKPVMLAGGMGQIQARQLNKQPLKKGTLLIQIGGPGFNIGLGGGAASSMDSGANGAELDFASVQRANPEMQRRCQELIDRCWQLGDDNPILSIHDVGAGGLSNALPELVAQAACGAHIALRHIPSEDAGMSPLQIWSNEAQERYVLALLPQQLDRFSQLAQRERCPFAVVGTVSDEGVLTVHDELFNHDVVSVPMSVLFDSSVQLVKEVSSTVEDLAPFVVSGEHELRTTVYRVLRHPTVGDKSFLITIADRSVGGLTARDQMVGPWQIPVADVAVVALGFNSVSGQAMALAERAPIALLNAPASGRMALAEALTNIAAASIGELNQVKLSANWMAAAGHPGEEAKLYATVKAVSELAQALNISIPVGKDSLSMKTVWQEEGVSHSVTAPLTAVMSAFALVKDVRHTLTPELKAQDSDLILLDLGFSRCRLGGSIYGQVWQTLADDTPDVDSPQALILLFNTLQALIQEEKILAYHDRSDGGLIACLAEMMFASRLGLSINIQELLIDHQNTARSRKNTTTLSARAALHDRIMRVLFNEEIGVIIQVSKAQSAEVIARFVRAGLSQALFVIGTINQQDRLIIERDGCLVLDEHRCELQRAWSQTSQLMQQKRDCLPVDRVLEPEKAPGLWAKLSFDVHDNPALPYLARNVRPKVAILREQGVNGQIEMAAAFDRAGFTALDISMSDLISGRSTLMDVQGLVACGGFSYGDVLGAGTGWAKSILFNPRLRALFEQFFKRADVFALGVCNGCQMMAQLSAIIPGAAQWPSFQRNESEQFEARLVMVEVNASPSIFLSDMVGSQLPVIVSHAEGRVQLGPDTQPLVALQFIGPQGQATERYPFNPNGSPKGIAALTTADGRFTIMMPHPERGFRTVQNAWHPQEWGEDGAWLRMFTTARRWVG